jgi:ketosteroid isomerase-like protein
MNTSPTFSRLLQQGLRFAGLALAWALPACGRAADAVPPLVQRSHDSNAALMQGDIERYQALLTLAQDFTLMSPFGGEPSHGLTPEGMRRLGRFFRNGSFEQELVRAYGSSELVVLALIERTVAEVGGLPSQPWALRVTLVYRRQGKDWQLVHRHADPLVAGISLTEAAELARRDPKP